MDRSKQLLPAALLAEIEALAESEHRHVGEVLREAVERYLYERQPTWTGDGPMEQREPISAAKRMREQRRRHPLPDGMTLRDLLTFGRA